MKKILFAALVAIVCVALSSCKGETPKYQRNEIFSDEVLSRPKSPNQLGYLDLPSEVAYLMGKDVQVIEKDGGLAIKLDTYDHKNGEKIPRTYVLPIKDGLRCANTGDKIKVGDKIQIFKWADLKKWYFIYRYEDVNDDDDIYYKWFRENGKKILKENGVEIE